MSTSHAMIDMDVAEESARFSLHEDSASNPCKLCLDEIQPGKKFHLQSCGCFFCVDCMKSYVEVLVTDGVALTISCPDAECVVQGRLQLSEVSSLINGDLLETYYKLREEQEVAVNPYQTFCPTPDCSTICSIPVTRSHSTLKKVRNLGKKLPPVPSQVFCPKCVQSFCHICKAKWTDKHKCKEQEFNAGNVELGIKTNAKYISNHTPRMGCSSSKDAVRPIKVENGVVKPVSAKKIKVQASNDYNARSDNAKSASAKSRDSGIDEMDGSGLSDGVITEESDPHLITDIEGERRPDTPNLSLIGQKFTSNTVARERMKSRAILEELESQGLIKGTKVGSGGAAFEVEASSPAGILEPLPPLRPPPRLERLKQDKPALTKEELEFKQLQADMRRQKSMHKPKKRSRLASQLAKDRQMAGSMEPNDDNLNDDGSAYKFNEKITDPFKSTHQIPHD